MGLIEQMDKLPHFLVVFEQRSLRKASQVLNMTQPPLSTAIKKLEEAMGVQLFHRTQKGVDPTEAGVLLYKHAKKMIADLQNIEHSILNPNRNMVGRLSVGTYDSIARYFWPQILSESKKLYPELQMTLTSSRTYGNISNLENSEIDYAILVDPVELFSRDNEFIINRLYRDQYGIFIGREFQNSLKTKENLLYVSKASAGDGLVLEDMIKVHGLSGHHEHRLDSFEVCREFVKKGLGIGILPLRVAKSDCDSREIIPTRLGQLETFGSHGIYEVYPGNHIHLEKLKHFSEIVHQLVK